MRTNSFTTIMRTKSNNELETILSEKNKYTAEAIQAVTWVLEDRGLIEKPTILLDKTTKELVETATFKDKTAINKNPFKEFETPFLYSKNTILGFTIFFSTIFGAVLLMHNLKKMNKPKARNQVLVFGILYTIGATILLNYLPKSIFTTLLLNLVGYMVLSEYFWNNNLGKDLKHQIKQIWMPLGISILIVIALIFLVFLSQNLQQ